MCEEISDRVLESKWDGMFKGVLEGRFNGEWDSLPISKLLGIVVSIFVGMWEGVCEEISDGVLEGEWDDMFKGVSEGTLDEEWDRLPIGKSLGLVNSDILELWEEMCRRMSNGVVEGISKGI